MEKTLNIPLGPREPEQRDNASGVTRVQHVTSSVLLAGAREVVIEHAGREYRLRLTGNGKLILTA